MKRDQYVERLANEAYSELSDWRHDAVARQAMRVVAAAAILDPAYLARIGDLVFELSPTLGREARHLIHMFDDVINKVAKEAAR